MLKDLPRSEVLFFRMDFFIFSWSLVEKSMAVVNFLSGMALLYLCIKLNGDCVKFIFEFSWALAVSL